MKKQKEKRKVGPVRKWIERLILVAALCGFVYAAFNLASIFMENNAERDEINKIREIVKVPNTEKELDTFKIDFKKLQDINPDVVGYIVVKDTDISYPVVKGTDNEFYLTHTFRKNENYAGAIFMDYRNKGDLSDLNTFVYGHNVKHGTMFAELSKYMDKGFFEKHPYVYYYTPDANYKLQVYSAYSALGNSDSWRLDFASKDDYQGYLNKVKGLSRYDSGVEMGVEDHMLTLYTCSYENSDSTEYNDDRYFIHLKIIDALSGEMPIEKVE